MRVHGASTAPRPTSQDHTRRCPAFGRISDIVRISDENRTSSGFARFWRGPLPEFIEHFHKLLARSQNAWRGRWDSLWSCEQTYMGNADVSATQGAGLSALPT
jgi:hypothetical protein